jgi:hypothetical protein
MDTGKLKLKFIIWFMMFFGVQLYCLWTDRAHGKEIRVLKKAQIIQQLEGHLTMLTRTIGERSINYPVHLEQSAQYLQAQFESYGLAVEQQVYRYASMNVSNVVARFKPRAISGRHYVIGAHYDSVSGTVGADDNASAVAVLLETARAVQRDYASGVDGPEITFVAFTLEEPPAYGTPFMGSRKFASMAREKGMSIDGMICLEMVGYTCSRPGCQSYPFPLKYLGYPKEGTFIGVVGNVKSYGFSRRLSRSFKRNPNLPIVSLTVPFDGKILPAIRLSDHASFWDKGYPAVMVTDSAFFRNPHYHQPSDTMETLDMGFMAELVQGLMIFFGALF